MIKRKKTSLLLAGLLALSLGAAACGDDDDDPGTDPTDLPGVTSTVPLVTTTVAP